MDPGRTPPRTTCGDSRSLITWDYAFVPQTWPIQNVDVGKFEDYWAKGGMSDHVPIVVTLTPG
jgi:hypothetical protein